MTRLAEYPYPPEVIARASRVAGLFEQGSLHRGEASLAHLTLELLTDLTEGAIKRETADQVFTLLDMYLTDRQLPLELSEEAQELLLEGEYFHRYREPFGADPQYLRDLATKILGRTESH